MSDVSRRRFMGTATGIALSGAASRTMHAQEPDSAAVRIRASQELAKLVQVQVMIGNGVDYEFLRMFEEFSDLNIRVSPSPAAFRTLMPDPAPQAGRGGWGTRAPNGTPSPGGTPQGGGGFRRATDVIVLFDQIYDMPEENQQSLMRYVEAGKGIIVLHNALTDYQRWPYWYRDVVGGSFLQVSPPNQFVGMHERGPAEEMLPDKPASSPDKSIAPGVWDFQEYTVKPVGNHPIIMGVQRFTVRDEKYKNVWKSDKITSILETDDPGSDKVVGWVGPHPKAKVFAFMLGHSAEAHAHPVYRQIIHNAILWTGGRLA